MFFNPMAGFQFGMTEEERKMKEKWEAEQRAKAEGDKSSSSSSSSSSASSSSSSTSSSSSKKKKSSQKSTAKSKSSSSSSSSSKKKKGSSSSAEREGVSAAAAAGLAPAPKPSAVRDAISVEEKLSTEKKQKGAKTDSSYYYFSSTSAEEAKRFAPKKLDVSADTVDEEVKKHSSSGSLWNVSGATMEELDYSEWTQNRLRSVLEKEYNSLENALFVSSDGNIRVWVESVDKVDGSATFLHARGKLRHGYDLEMKVKFKGKVKDKDVSGTIEMEDICETDEPDEWSYNVRIKDMSRMENQVVRSFLSAASQKKQLTDVIEKVIQEFIAKKLPC